MAETVRVKGLVELRAALKEIDKGLDKELRERLRDAGDVVRADAQSLFSGVDARSAAGYKVRVRKRGVVVEQSLRRVTGLRGDYGALQMRTALSPALEQNTDEVFEKASDAIDELSRKAGF